MMNLSPFDINDKGKLPLGLLPLDEQSLGLLPLTELFLFMVLPPVNIRNIR
jgi:hypothetical protein